MTIQAGTRSMHDPDPPIEGLGHPSPGDAATLPVGPARPARTEGLRRAGRVAAGAAALLLALGMLPAAVAADGDGHGGRDHGRGDGVGRALAGVRRATDRFHRVAAAEAAGYASFYVCTDEPGIGGMGQHYVNGTLVADPGVDARHPEALVYEPTAHGLRLVAVEYVVFQADWDATHSSPPRLFGRTFGLNTAPNRYGLPAFYELHAWIWRWNPLGTFYEWNPRVRCP